MATPLLFPNVEEIYSTIAWVPSVCGYTYWAENWKDRAQLSYTVFDSKFLMYASLNSKCEEECSLLYSIPLSVF